MEFLGFATGHADDLPFAMSLVSPRYAAGQSAVTRLLEGERISREEEGFSELEAIFRERLRANPLPDISDKLSLDHISTKKLSTVTLSGVIQQFDLGIVWTLSNDQPIEDRLSEVRPHLDAWKREDILRFSICSFAFGIFLQIIGFLVEWRAAGRRNRRALTPPR